MSDPLRVLVVDDEAVILMQLELLLEELGHRIVGLAMSATEALKLVHETRPDLLLLDLHLNDGSSGLDVARAVRGMEDITTVIITANLLKLGEDMEGAAAVLAKPFTDRTIEGAIAYMEECVRRPPPQMQRPLGLRLAPAYMARMEGMRAARR